MEINTKIEELKFTISRYDHYYDTVNNKGNLYLSVNTFLMGGLISGYYALHNVQPFTLTTVIFFVIALLANFFSWFFTLAATIPYLTKDEIGSSLIFFAHVANCKQTDNSQQWDGLMSDTWYIDLKEQHHSLACGLKAKFNKLYCATWFIGAQLVCILFLGFFLLSK